MPEAPGAALLATRAGGLVAVAAAAFSAVLPRQDGRRLVWRAALPVSAARRRPGAGPSA
jgi:hypothetical protein